MKILNKDKIKEVGYVKKTHGVHGELIVQFRQAVPDEFFESEYVFILLNGLPVPFRLAYAEELVEGQALLKLDLISIKEEAQKLVASPLCMLCENDELDPEKPDFELLKGYQLYDSHGAYVGEIENFDDYAGNMLVSIIKDKEEYLIPINEQLIRELDAVHKKIVLDIPDGLLD